MKKEIKILIIDDSNTNVVLLEAILSGQGYTIDTCLSATEAFNSIEKSKPDLILLDLLMPKVSGYDFMIKLNEDEKNKDIPVIVISAVSDYDNIKKILDLGVVDYIKKPVDIEDLSEKVGKILDLQETNH